MKSAWKSVRLYQNISKYRLETLILIIFHLAAAAAGQAEAAAVKFPDEARSPRVSFFFRTSCTERQAGEQFGNQASRLNRLAALLEAGENAQEIRKCSLRFKAAEICSGLLQYGRCRKNHR